MTRARFRRKLLECDYVMQTAVKVLQRVHDGELPFDRTVQVSVTDRLEKDQILGRLPHNLRTLETLLKRNRRDYRHRHQQVAPDGRSAATAWRRLGRRRRRAVRLVEELGLRTQRIEPMIKTLGRVQPPRRRAQARGSTAQRQERPRAAAEQREPWIAEYPQHPAGHAGNAHAACAIACSICKADLRPVPGGQARPVGRQPAAGRLDRQEVSQPRPELPGPDPGRQRRPDAGGRQVRVSPRLQVLHLCHVVDSPGDHPGRGRPEPHDPHSGAHGRDDVAGAERLAASCCRSWAASRRSKRRPSAAGTARRRSPPRAGHEPLSDQPRPAGGQQRRQPLRRPAARRRRPRARPSAPPRRCSATGSPRCSRRSATASARSSSSATAWATATATRWKKSGHIFKVTRERIRQIEAKAVRKLQQPSRSQELVGFLD